MQLVTITEAAERLAVSPDTIKRRLRRGELLGHKQPRPQGFTWMIEVEESDGLESTQAETQAATDAGTHASTGELHRLEELVAVLQSQLGLQQEHLTVKDQQLEGKDRQISELHVLLQQAQAALPAPKENRPWWRFWKG